MLRIISSLILKLFGWQVGKSLPACSRYVLVAAPHTSYWDFPLAMLGMAATGIRFHLAATKGIFRWPFGILMRLLGVIPVNRSMRSDFVEKMVSLFDEKKDFILAIAPEGTRMKTDYWKTGFYYIALEAEVPIALGYMDYGKKIISVGPTLTPSGNIEEDFGFIRDFYSDKKGKYPENQGEARTGEKGTDLYPQ